MFYRKDYARNPGEGRKRRDLSNENKIEVCSIQTRKGIEAYCFHTVQPALRLPLRRWQHLRVEDFMM